MEKISVLTGSLLGTLLASSVLAAPALASPNGQLSQHGRWLVDASGRALMVRGGNVMLPRTQDLVPASQSQPEDWTAATPQRIAEQGFNGVRLVIFLSELMPQPGRLDAAYLDRIARTVAAYKAVGIRTLLDFHQDEYGPKVGIRGMPDWATFTNGHERIAGLGFPMGYFKDPAVQIAFDNFWANHRVPGTDKGVQDLYIEALAAVVRRFRSDPAVLGIDIMNEPATGSRCADLNPRKADCPELQQTLLKPFYDRAARAISAVAPKMLIFVEPFMLQGALGIPRIETPIAGPAGRRGLSFHSYGQSKATRDRVNDRALDHATTSNAALLNTEWGNSTDPVLTATIAGEFDQRLMSWLAWPVGSFEAILDPALKPRFGGNRAGLLRAYARPYPEWTAGTPVSLSFDPDSGEMRYRYTTTLPEGRVARADLLTEIRIPKVQYPGGYKVEVTGGMVVSAANDATLKIRNVPGARMVSVAIARQAALAPLASFADNGVEDAALFAKLPAIPAAPLSRRSMIGHILATPGGREALEAELPGIVEGMRQLSDWPAMTLADFQKLAPSTLDDAKLARLDRRLGALKVTSGPIASSRSTAIPGLDATVADLLADPRTRAILEREAPGLASASQRDIYPQIRLRDLQPVLPDILTKAVLARIEAAISALRTP